MSNLQGFAAAARLFAVGSPPDEAAVAEAYNRYYGTEITASDVDAANVLNELGREAREEYEVTTRLDAGRE